MRGSSKIRGGPTFLSLAKRFERELTDEPTTLPHLNPRGIVGPFPWLRDHVGNVEVERRFL